MKIEWLAFTDGGFALALRLSEKLGGKAARCGRPESLGQWTKRAFYEAEGLVFVGAAGIAVRAIAPYVKSKSVDPAVVVLDECGRFAVPILSGHLGGANTLARRIASCCGAVPVITTATDIKGVFAVDEWAKKQGFVIQNPEKIKSVSAKILTGDTALLYTDYNILGEIPLGVAVTEDDEYDFVLTIEDKGGDALRLVPPIAVVGIGCRRGTAKEEIERAFSKLLAKKNVCRQAVCRICSVDLKQDEPGILEFCRDNNLPFDTFPAERLKVVKGSFASSAFVQEVTGVDNICERSAVLGSGGELYIEKTVSGGVTMAMALKPFAPDWRWRDE